MRCFFALEPDSETKLAIEQWRQQSLPPINRPVPAANFHITLAFLGQLDPNQFDTLLQAMDNFDTLPGCSVVLDQLGYWPKPKALWLGTQQTSAELTLLNEALSRTARQCHIHLQKRPYVPHLTLFRKCQDNPPAALVSPHFECHFSQFHLFESVSTHQGVRYQRRATWPLLPIKP